MKKVNLLTTAILILVVLAATALAGDYAEVKFIGFSENGKYLAFEESGERDVHSGGDYATTYFVDVDKNVYAAAPAVFQYSDNDMSAARQLPRAAQKRLYAASVSSTMKRLKIIRGNTGRLVVAHLDTDRSFEKPVMKETDFFKADGSMVRKVMPFYEGKWMSSEYDPFKVVFNPILNPVNPRDDQFYELALKLSPADKPCEARGVAVDASMIELTLKDNTHSTDSRPRILQKDRTLPAARNCPNSYAIEQVYYYDNRLAVVLAVYTMGFPGSSRRYMIVTGGIDDENNS